MKKESPDATEQQERLTLPEALRHHAELMLAPEVDPLVRVKLMDAATLMNDAADALLARSEIATPHLVADSVSDEAKAKAFEWLRSVSLGGGPDAKLAMIAQDEWHRCRELITPSARALAVSVDERLPAYEEPVLMWHAWLKHWVNGKLVDAEAKKFQFMDGGTFYPSYWMALPEVPHA